MILKIHKSGGIFQNCVGVSIVLMPGSDVFFRILHSDEIDLLFMNVHPVHFDPQPASDTVGLPLPAAYEEQPDGIEEIEIVLKR